MTTIASEFKQSQKMLSAIGDETRQAILMALMQGPQTPGMRVGEIKVITHLSRPSVSHHLKILKEAGVISVRKEGTHHYYRLDSGSKLVLLKSLVNELDKVFAQCQVHPDRTLREQGDERE